MKHYSIIAVFVMAIILSGCNWFKATEAEVAPYPTAYPTYTPAPTYTPYPTYTLVPTAYPTYTPYPTPTTVPPTRQIEIERIKCPSIPPTALQVFYSNYWDGECSDPYLFVWDGFWAYQPFLPSPGEREAFKVYNVVVPSGNYQVVGPETITYVDRNRSGCKETCTEIIKGSGGSFKLLANDGGDVWLTVVNIRPTQANGASYTLLNSVATTSTVPESQGEPVQENVVASFEESITLQPGTYEFTGTCQAWQDTKCKGAQFDKGMQIPLNETVFLEACPNNEVWIFVRCPSRQPDYEFTKK